MLITDVGIYQYELDLTAPFFVRGRPLSTREGFIIHLQLNQIQDAFGEVAPLPGLSRESRQEVVHQLKSVKEFLTGKGVPDQVVRLKGDFEEWLGVLQLYPSVRFGVEMAVLNGLAEGRGKPLQKLLLADSENFVRINGLLQGDETRVVSQAHHLIQQGFRSLKLKVGPDIDQSVAKVRAVTEAVAGKALLHLDANQCWDLSQAVEFGRKIGCVFVDYIEEPLKNIQEAGAFYQQTQIPVAVDESLGRCSFEDLKSLEGLDVIVIKPTLVGGLEKAWQLVQRARQMAVRPVISSCLESSLGLLTLGQFAAVCGRQPVAGLDTAKWLSADLLQEDILLSDGKMIFPEDFTQAAQLRRDLLTEVVF